MKNLLTLLIIIFFTSVSFAQQADDVVGKYHLPNDLDVQIFKYNGKYFGKIIGLNKFEDGQTTDINNPEDNKQKDLLLGKIIIKNLEFDKDEKQWINGEMYGPEKGIIFNLKVTEVRKSEIEVVGSKYLFWHTLEWEKI